MSLTFQDAKGRTWSLKLSIDAVDRIAELTGLDLLATSKECGAAYRKIMGDARILLNVAWHVIAPQAQNLNVPIEDFRASIDGNAIEAIGEAFTEALADFSPTSLRTMIRAGWKKGKEAETSQLKGGLAAIEKTDLQEMEQRAEAQVAAELGKLMKPPENSSTASLESSASTPAP